MSFDSSVSSSSSNTWKPSPLVRVPAQLEIPRARGISGDRSFSSDDLTPKPLSKKWMEEAKRIYPQFKKKIENDPKTQYKIGMEYFEGTGRVLQNNFKAIYWLNLAADGGHDEAQRQLAFWHITGAVVGKSYSLAKDLLKQSVAKDNKDSLYLAMFLTRNNLADFGNK